MVLEALRIIGSILLILFIPGYLFIQALFPRKNELDETDDFLYRVVLAISMSIIISILVGFVLGSLGTNPSTGKGYFQTFYIVLSLIVISVVLFFVGLYRNAYPFFNRRFKPRQDLPITEDEHQDFINILEQWRDQKEKLERLEYRMKEGTKSTRANLKPKHVRILRNFNKINDELKELASKKYERPTEAKKLHGLITEWKNLKQELQQCEQRIDLSKGMILERNIQQRDELVQKVKDIEKDITFLRDDSE
jgi:hypothetical protein